MCSVCDTDEVLRVQFVTLTGCCVLGSAVASGADDDGVRVSPAGGGRPEVAGPAGHPDHVSGADRRSWPGTDSRTKPLSGKAARPCTAQMGRVRRISRHRDGAPRRPPGESHLPH